jgi:hypothetical protein
MKTELQTTIESYVELLEEIKTHTENSQEAVGILGEIRKDQRMQQPQQKRVVNGNLAATENQIAYLKRLGAEIPEGLTRQEASQMIDDQKERIAMQKAMQQPIRIP